MKFHIPFTIGNLQSLKKRSEFLKTRIKHKKESNLQEYLDNSDTGLTREEYLAIIIKSSYISFIFILVISALVLWLFKVRLFLLFSILLAIAFTLFIHTSQRIYPRVYSTRKDRNIEKNLIPALQDMLVQLNSGINLFSILVNISYADYGELSTEFKKTVRRMSAGVPEIDVLEDLGKRNSSKFFKRTLWQLSNGMKSGSDIAIIIKENIKALNEEQLIQIQNYGNKLNPLIMFYMITSVILPALAITFITIISSIVNLPEFTTILLYISLSVLVSIIQVMFLGVIKSARPSLL